MDASTGQTARRYWRHGLPVYVGFARIGWPTGRVCGLYLRFWNRYLLVYGGLGDE
jgi:hypothetical protein